MKYFYGFHVPADQMKTKQYRANLSFASVPSPTFNNNVSSHEEELFQDSG